MKPKLTEEMVDTIVDLKRNGLNDKDIYEAIGVSHTSFYRWINNPQTKLQRALGERLKKAESDYKEELLNCIRDAAMAKNSFWTAAAWLLERKYPDQFSQGRLEKKNPDMAPQIVLGVSVKPVEEDADNGK